MTDLKSKRVIITGASRGIGEAAARHFAAHGAKVMLAARNGEAVRRIADEIGGEALACDVSDYAQVKAVVDHATTTFGGVDVLINNAGLIDPIARLDESDPAAWGHVVDVNLKGVYYGYHAVLPGMLAQGSGTIINISSGAASGALEGWSHYCATKAAVLALTRCGHKEYGDLGIRVMGLSPGTVATDMQRDIKASGINPVAQLDWERHIPPEWVARALAVLMGPDGDAYLGTDMSLRTDEARRLVGLPPDGA